MVRTLRTDDRGQALTLEAVTAAILMLLAVAFALQMTAVTPLSASTSSQHLENQLQKSGDGMLAASQVDDSLDRAVLDWDQTEEAFEGADSQVGYYRSGPPDNDFGDVLRETYGDRNIAFNVVVHYHTVDGTIESQQMVDQGDPSDHAVSASRTVALSEEDTLTDGTELQNADFYAPDVDIDGDRSLYNLLRVEVVAWRI